MALPPPDRRPLRRPRLALVVCQARFNASESIHQSDVANALYKRLGGTDGRLPRFSQVQAQRLTVTPGSPEGVTSQEQKGWQFASATGDLQLTVFPDSLSVETPDFRKWEDFGPTFASAIEALHDVVAPATEERVGLRFVNTVDFDDVVTISDWGELVNPLALGLASDAILGEGVTALESRALVVVDGDVRSMIRSTFQPSESAKKVGLMLDLDTYAERAQPFIATDVIALADRLNDYSVSLFQTLATPALLARLGHDDEEATG